MELLIFANFLKEIDRYIPNSFLFIIVDDDDNKKKFYFHHHDSNNFDNQINILITESIYVFLSLNFLKNGFEIEKKVFYSSIGTENKEMKTVKLQNHVRTWFLKIDF